MMKNAKRVFETPEKNAKESITTPMKNAKRVIKTPQKNANQSIKTPIMNAKRVIKTPMENAKESFNTPMKNAKRVIKTPMKNAKESFKTLEARQGKHVIKDAKAHKALDFNPPNLSICFFCVCVCFFVLGPMMMRLPAAQVTKNVVRSDA